MARVLVVGAGIAGLVGAGVLQRGDHEVVVLDRGKRPGGRMATRRPDGPRGPVFDHGAQFVTLREEELAEETHRWQQEGWLVEWFRGAPDPGMQDEDGHPRYRGKPYQRTLAEELAEELDDVRCDVRVAAISHDGRWRATLDDETSLDADGLLCTPPAPQTVELLDAGGVTLPEQLDAELRRVTFDPCIAVLAVPTGRVDLPDPGIVRLPEDDVLDMVTDNVAKGVSNKPAVTIHATAEWSRTHWDDADGTVGPALLAVARDLLGTSADVRHVHRWRHSAPSSRHDDVAPGGSEPGPVRFAGDAFAGGRVEGAALSGWTAAHRLLDEL